MVTPSQIKVWLEILQRFPMEAFFWISTKAPIFVCSPIRQPYRLTKAWMETSLPSETSGAIRHNSTGSSLWVFDADVGAIGLNGAFRCFQHAENPQSGLAVG